MKNVNLGRLRNVVFIVLVLLGAFTLYQRLFPNMAEHAPGQSTTENAP